MFTINERKFEVGIATLLGLLYSLPENSNPVLSFFKAYGSIAADMFVFLLGIGSYMSLSAEPSTSIFFKKRLIRLLPSYYTFLLFWLQFRPNPFPLKLLLENVFCIMYRLNLFVVHWYVSGIWLFYIFSKIFFRIVQYADFKRTAVVCALLLLYSVSFWNFRLYLLISSRFPLLFFSMFVGKCIKKESKVTSVQYVVLYAVMIVGCVLMHFAVKNQKWEHGALWYPGLLIVPGMCHAILVFCRILEHQCLGHFVVVAISMLGTFSFEIFLMKLLPPLILPLVNIEPVSSLVFSLVFSLIGGVVLYLTVQLLQKIYAAVRPKISDSVFMHFFGVVLVVTSIGVLCSNP